MERDDGRSGEALARAASAWLDGLDPRQRDQATFPFEDTERFVWHYVPGPRRGLSLGEMTPAQDEAAFEIVAAALSARGAAEVRAIVDLEPILGEIEQRGGRAGVELRRDPAKYWFAVFGDPAGEGSWSWRIGGHHIAVTTTVAGSRIIASTPSFLGANPATVPDGPRAGQRTLEGEERLARELLASLTLGQRSVAVVDPIAPPDILSGTGRRADVREIPVGIRASDLATPQHEALERLIRHYLDRAAPRTAVGVWSRLVEDDFGAVTFAWAGPDAPGRGHYYAIRGPSLLIEYDNTQNGANHIHSVWRDLANDWGDDVLAGHYAEAHRGP